MKPKTKRRTYVFRSTWSNHPNGRSYKGWDNDKEPPSKYYSDIYDSYLPKDAYIQEPTKAGYYIYPDGVKVKNEEFGNTSLPYGEYTWKVTMIFPVTD